MTQEVRYNRKELYELVWSQPMLKVAKQHGMSDRGIAKICRRMNIPVPPRGYWAKLQNGKKVKKIALPPPQAGQDHDVYFQFDPNAEAEMDQEHTRNAERNKPIQPQLQYEQDPANRIRVSATLIEPHPLVSKLARSLETARPGKNELLLKLPPRRLDVHVTESTRNRALCIIDALLKAMEARGYAVDLTAEDRAATCVKVNEEVFVFSLEERIARTEKELTPEQKEAVKKTPFVASFYRDYEFSPTGQLVFKYMAPADSSINHKWKDGEKYKLEDRLNEIIKLLLIDSIRIKENRKEVERRELERQEELRRWEERRRLAEEQERRAKEEQNRRDEFFNYAALWEKSERASIFIKSVKDQYLKNNPELKSDSKFAQWLAWAEQMADRINPITNQNSSFWKLFQ